MKKNLDDPNDLTQNSEFQNIEVVDTVTTYDGVDFFGYERKSIFYKFFTLIDDIIKLHYWRQLYYILKYLIPILQLIILTFYPYLPDKWNRQPGENGYSCCKFIHGFACICTLAPPSSEPTFHIPSFMAISLISGLLLIIPILYFIYYMFNSQPLPFFLPLISFILQILIFVFYFPTLTSFVSTFSGLLKRESLSIFGFTYLLIVSVLLSCFIYFSSSLINFESNPNRSFFATFNGKHVYHVFYIYGIAYIMINICQYLSDWIIYFVVVLKILLTIFLIIEVFSFPFVHFYSNIFAVSFYVMTVLSDVFLLLKNISPYVRLLVPLLIFVVSFGVFTFVFNFIKKRIMKALNCLNNCTDEEKIQIYRKSIKTKSLNKAYRILRIGFVFKSRQILKGKISILMAEKMKSIEYWVSLCSFFSYFPSEKENFSLCVRKLKSLLTKTFVQKQRILHLMNMEHQHYLTGDNEIPQRLRSLEIATKNSIALVKQFWIDINKDQLKNPMRTLDFIAYEINDTQNMWLINLNLFPNEYRFAAEYSLFLIECVGNFEDGIIWLLKASHLEKGFHAAIDELFRVFVCSLPYFLHDKVVNKHGLLLMDETKNDAENTESVPDVTQQDKLEEDFENGLIEKLMNEKFYWPTLRNYLYRATSHYRPKHLSIFNTLKIISFIIILVILIVMTALYSQEFKKFQYTYDIIELFGNIRVGISFLYSLFILQWQNYTSHETYNLNYWIDYTEINYIQFFYQMSQFATSGEKISLLSRKIIEDNIQNYFCFIDSNNDFLSKPYYTNMKSSIVSTLLTLQSLIHSNYSTLNNSIRFCSLNLFYPELPNSFTNVSLDFSNLVFDINKDSQQTIIILIIVFVVFSFVLWIPSLIAPQMILQNESKKIVSALEKVDSNASLAASQQLTKIEEDEAPQNYMFQYLRNTYISAIWLWQVLYFLMVLIIFVFFAVSTYFVFSSCNRLERFILLDHFSSTRHGLCIELFSLTIYKIMAVDADLKYFNFSYINDLFNNYVDQTILNSNIFIHGYDGNGMSDYSDEIEKLHIKDKCQSSYGQSDYYDCMSFQRLISAFIVLAKDLMNDDFGFDSSKFNELYNLVITNLDSLNEKSRYLMGDLIHNTKSKSLKITTVLLTLAILMTIILFFYDIMFINKLTSRMNTALLLIRHLPPPSVVETKAILDILLVKMEDHKDQNQDSVNDVIFNSITTPALIIGEGNIIEKANSSFQFSFGFPIEKIVGHNLNYFIPQSEEDEGSINLYQMMIKIEEGEADESSFVIDTKCISNEQDENHNDIMMNVTVTVYTVIEDQDINGFVLFVKDKSRTANIENQLHKCKKTIEGLMCQLVPYDLRSAVRNEGNDFGYIIPRTVVLVVHINHINDILEKNWEDYNAIISELESDAKINPPFVFLHTVYDVVSFIGGLIADKEMSELASISLEFAHLILKTLDNKISINSNNNDKRFSVAIASGGPLVAGFFKSIDSSSFNVINSSRSNNKSNRNSKYSSKNRGSSTVHNSSNKFFLRSGSGFSSFGSALNIYGSNNNVSSNNENLHANIDNIPVFTIMGKLLLEAAQMAISSPSENIVVSNDVKSLLENNKSISYLDGPVVKGNQTFLISSNIDNDND